MNVTKSVETRTVENIRYVSVNSLAAIGSDLVTAGVGRVKVVKLAKGGYTVKPLGDTAIWTNDNMRYGWGGTARRYVDGQALLRVDGEEAYIANLFE